jgi:DNA-3-methyladenine glycosylase
MVGLLPRRPPANLLISMTSVQKLPPLPRKFYTRDPRVVGRELLGKVLVRRVGRSLVAGRIVEAEAYMGNDDPAAHSANGRTERNQVLFGPPGHAYVYFIYGSYYCLNVSCMQEGDAGCVLIRALEPLQGIEVMARERELNPELDLTRVANQKKLTSGPGRLCDALSITRARDNGKDLTIRDDGFWIGDDGFEPEKVLATPRIGITKAVEHPLRYVVAGSPFVSGKNHLRG